MTRLRGPWLTAGLLLVAAGVIMLAVGAATASSAERTVVKLIPPSQNSRVGESVSVDIEVENVRDLAAFEFGIAYDPDVLQFAHAQETAFLASTGRSLFCAEPQVGDDNVLFGCGTTAEKSPPGVDGDGVLAKVTFSAVGSGTSPLTFTKIQLSDWNSYDSWGIDNDGDGRYNEDPVDGIDGDNDGQVDEDPPESDLLVIQEAAVKVVSSGQSSSSSLPPTPTPNPSALTPTPVVGAPTPDPGYTLPAGDQNYPRTGSQQYAGSSSGRETGVSPSGAADAAGSGEGFPGAGTGTPAESTPWTTAAGAGLAASGLALLWIGMTYHRLRHRSSRTDR